MFSRTPVAKQFRRWVLDVLDKLEEEERTKTELVKNLDRLPFLFPSHRSELKGIVNAKISTYPASVQGKARPEIWTRFKPAFPDCGILPASDGTHGRSAGLPVPPLS